MGPLLSEVGNLKLPTTHSEQCCSLVVSAHFPTQTVAPLDSVVFSVHFLIFFSVVEQVRFFLLLFSFRPKGDWQVCSGKFANITVGPKCE